MDYRNLVLLVMLSGIAISFQVEDNMLQKKQVQEHSLLAFKSIIKSDPNQSLIDWIPSQHTFCNWTGIMCSKDMNTVVALNLTGMSLQGIIPPFLGNLTDLQVLILAQNDFFGQIPFELASLKRLKFLNLSQNNLTGAIPNSLSSLSSLNSIDVSQNEISGNIPSELGLLRNLQVLNLAQNRLTGRIPVALSNISTLADLKLFHNYLSGEIPWEFCVKIPNLQNLWLWENQLSGGIPKSVVNCSRLIMFIANNNNLTGTIPDDFGRIKTLQRLKVQNNQLTSRVGHANPNSFITALANCSSLEHLSIGNNNLSGNLPSSIGRLSKNLTLLYMSSNAFDGSIPPEIGNLTGLNFLGLNWNSFQGSIPSELGALANMERLQLQHNKLQGRIPESLGKLSHLGLLDLSQNMLSGEIPNFIGSLSQLRYLILHHNNFSGSIPSSLMYTQNLEMLDLSFNLLSGVIPREIGRLSSLQFYLNISSNQLRGQVPLEIGRLNVVQAIDISCNRLEGNIPQQIENCIALQALNLSMNSLNGSIPSNIGELENLAVLDLSSNELSGIVPVPTLEGLKMLSYLNLSFNSITGVIGEQDFQNSSVSVFLEGNPGLCGKRELNLSPCAKSGDHHKLLLIILPISFIVILVGFVLLIMYKHKSSMAIPRIDFQASINQELFYKELVEATDGFSDSNLLGSGGFGTVYKGILGNNKVVAVKVINLQDDEIKSSFRAESSVLMRVKHRNLVKLINVVSTPSFKGLVFELMPNGSLEDNLHCSDENDNQEFCKLGFKARLRIAADVSHALEYLHHDCFIQVVHCDIKPANVLLDEDMSAHLTDFGISKLINVATNESFATTVAMRGTMGYIPPEYGLGGIVSTNGDVYSFGILLLELFTRKRPTSEMFVEGLTLRSWVSLSFPNRIVDTIDAVLFREFAEKNIDQSKAIECLTSLIHLSLLCTNEASQARPNMRTVTRSLEKLNENLFLE